MAAVDRGKQAAIEALMLVADRGGPTMFCSDRRDEGSKPTRRAQRSIRHATKSIGADANSRAIDEAGVAS
jgi:hypothetical protein